MLALAPHAHKVVVHLVVPGQSPTKAEVWPVDAREMVAAGWTYGEPAGMPVSAPSAPLPAVTVNAQKQLSAMAWNDLQKLAAKLGLPGSKVSKEDLIASLLPHVEAGTLSLEVLPVGPFTRMTPTGA